MKQETIIRAWKDPEFRASLSAEERSALPECPAGQAFTELDEAELADAVGGALALNYSVDDGCICSNWTGGLTSRVTTLTTTRVVNQADLASLSALRF
jgi:mersacidin/lichenicidin family type 2 lantibiotic